jgi:hypothetical protein
MLERVDAAEIAELAADYLQEPWGERRADLGHAIVASVMASAWSAKGKRFDVATFMPDFAKQGRLKRRRTLEEQRAYLMGLTLSLGGKVDPKWLPPSAN